MVTPSYPKRNSSLNSPLDLPGVPIRSLSLIGILILTLFSRHESFFVLKNLSE